MNNDKLAYCNELLNQFRESFHKDFPLHLIEGNTYFKLVVLLSEIYTEKELALLIPLRYVNEDISIGWADGVGWRLESNYLNKADIKRVRMDINNLQGNYTYVKYWNYNTCNLDLKQLQPNKYPLLLTSDMPFPSYTITKGGHNPNEIDKKAINTWFKKYQTNFNNTKILIDIFGDFLYNANIDFGEKIKLFNNNCRKYNILTKG